MELLAFLALTHGILIYFIVDGTRKSNAKTKRINKVVYKFTKDMSKEEITQWWKEFNQGDK